MSHEELVREVVPELRWQQAWEHRTDLLQLARRRTLNSSDAEDVVAEALLRSVDTEVDPEHLGAWLNTVVRRLCIDLARDRARADRREAYGWRHALPPATPEEVVCDRHQAQWASAQVLALPPRQRQALELRASGLVLEEVAEQLGASYKTTESLLSRARTALRSKLATTYGVGVLGAVLPHRWYRLQLLGSGTAATTTAAVGVLVMGGLALTGPATTPSPTPVLPRTEAAAPVEAVVVPRLDEPAARRPSAESARPAASAVAPGAASARAEEGAASSSAPREVLRTDSVGTRDTVQVGGVTVTEHDADESFQESLQECLDHHSADPLNLVEGTCPPD